MTLAALPLLASTAARAIAPRQALTVSQWADSKRILSSKTSAKTGNWRTDRSPLLREPMDCLSARSPVRDVVIILPVQMGKSEIITNAVGYTIDHDPCPIMVAFPGEASMEKFRGQKLGPLIEDTPAVAAALTSTASRNAANRANWKEFAGGNLQLEHAGSPARLKSSSIKRLLVDELDSFATEYKGGDDPVKMLDDRTTAFPGSYKRAYIGTPDLAGTSRLEYFWAKSDQRRPYVECPHCGEWQPLTWQGLHWTPDRSYAWYECRACIERIDERHKPDLIARARWTPENPGARIRGYRANALYYGLGMGLRWIDLVEEWLDAQHDDKKLKTFINSRLAEAWVDQKLRNVNDRLMADRAESYPLRTAPAPVLEITAGVDSQDNRVAVHIVGWSRRMQSFSLDYVELPGDPELPAVWDALVDLLQRPIEHESGALLRPAAVAIDMGGHRTEAVKNFVRSGRVRRAMAVFGAVSNNAPLLAKPKDVDVTWKGKTDKRGVRTYAVGTVEAKLVLYRRIAGDAERELEHRMVRFSDQLPVDFLPGLVSEVFNPSKNRFEKKGGARNEVLDTWVYAYAAAHHPEVRLHKRNNAEWDAAEKRLASAKRAPTTPPDDDSGSTPPAAPAPAAAPRETKQGAGAKRPWVPRRGGWMKR
jgi:phage terminase large subunit GpA-like protein